MKSTEELIKQGYIEDTSPGCGLVWWAYIHSMDLMIHLKRWWPPIPETLCDLENARVEKQMGNTNILYLVDKPFTARDHHEAADIAMKLFKRMGLTFKPDCYGNPSQRGCSSAERNRFRLLDIE